jgi:hypothetical protein
MTLGGAALGALGYGVSWQRRRHKSRVWPLLIASLIIALAFVMRSQVLEAFTGNWLPLGQFLVLVQALSSFDVRTRGGLYTALLLSGVVLFFASQQAFDGTFGVCLIGFVVLLLAFLSVSFLEDGARAAQVYWKKRQASIVLFWTGAACGVFALSGLAFWLMPRGETNLGLPQVAILPFSTNSLDSAATVPDVNLATIPVALGRGGEESALPIGPAGSPSGNDNMVGALSNRGDASGQMPGSVFLGNINKAGKDSDVVFFVRSKVASYWRGRALDIFDGRHWRASSASPDLARSRYSPQVWLNQESFGLNNRLRYTQTFFIQQDAPDAVFTGYRGVRVIAEEGSLQGPGVREGDSYQVISAHPKHSIERLRRSRAGWVGSRYLALPGGSGRLQELARRITQGADGDFAKLERIMGYLASQGKFDPHRPGDLTSSASLGEFLFEGQPGSALDTPRPRRCWPGPPGCPQGWPWATCRESATPCPALIWCGSGTPTPGPRYILKTRAGCPSIARPGLILPSSLTPTLAWGICFRAGLASERFRR